MDRKAVSPDSSTQVTDKEKIHTKRKHKHRSKKKKNKKPKSSPHTESDSGDKRCDTDHGSFTTLAELISNREELYLQLFKTIPKKEVKQLMPDILKKMSFKEVKRLCHQQLQLMSNTKLQSITSGKPLSSSEDSDEDSTGHEFDLLWKLNSLQDVHGIEKEKKLKEGKEEEKKDIIIFQEMITIPNQQEIDELVKGNSTSQNVDHSVAQGPFRELSSNQLNLADAVDEEAELKELEFRARALESLVRVREQQMKHEPAASQSASSM